MQEITFNKSVLGLANPHCRVRQFDYSCCVGRVCLTDLLPYQIITVISPQLTKTKCHKLVSCLFVVAFFFAVFVPNEPPEVFAEPLFQTVIEGEKAVFHCNASGIPLPSIAWQKMGSNFRNDTLYQNGLLTIDSVSSSDAGSYFCKAVNSEGEDSLNVQLEVMGKKQPILLFQKYRSTFNFSLEMKRIWIETDSHRFKIACENSDISRNLGLGKSQITTHFQTIINKGGNIQNCGNKFYQNIFFASIEYMLLSLEIQSVGQF